MHSENSDIHSASESMERVNPYLEVLGPQNYLCYPLVFVIVLKTAICRSH